MGPTQSCHLNLAPEKKTKKKEEDQFAVAGGPRNPFFLSLPMFLSPA
jgi:hypothetical protein